MRIRRVLGYARVSSELQGQGSSLQDQQNMLAAYAKAQGLPSPAFYVESESAIHEKNERRERIRALMSEVRAGDMVLCDKVDRWSRDPEFTYRSIREILSAGASFYAVGDQCDPSTPEGDTMLNFRVLFAKEEHKRIKLRLVGTRKLLRDGGLWTEGGVPLGYRRPLPKGHTGPTKNILVIDEEKAELVRRAFAMCIAGTSAERIAAVLGLKKPMTVGLLHSRTYLGEMRDSKGAWGKGKHPPIVDVDTFTRAQAALAKRKSGGARPRGTPAETSGWILRDVARCDNCGAIMGSCYSRRAPTPANPHPLRLYYYRCTHKCAVPYVRVGSVEDRAEPLIVARLEELKEELAREPKREAPPKLQDFAARRVQVQLRRDRALDAFTDGLMSKEELRARVAKLDAESLRIDGDEQAALRPNPLDDAGARRAVLRQVDAIAKAWTKATREERRTLVGHLAVSCRIATGQQPRFEWRSPEALAEVV